jgi:hypothetical protein
MLPTAPHYLGWLVADPKWRIALEPVRQSDIPWNWRDVADWNALLEWAGGEPAGLSLAEVDSPDPIAWARRIAQLRRWIPGHRVMIVGQAGLRPWAGVWLEAGAVTCAFSVREADRLAAIIRRFATHVPRSNQTIREAVASALPWPGLATPGLSA